MTTAVPLLDKTVDAAKRRGVGCVEVARAAKRIKLPLSAVQLRARVAGCLAHVTVTETFQNPFSEHLEAVYIFPLSGGCAVSSFQMKVGDRLIEGQVGERQAARKEYAEAMQQGKRTALLEQDRDDVFTVQVGNLPPGEAITVILSYSEKLTCFDQGTTEIRLPLVVAPRYVPGRPLERDSVGDGVELDTDIVPDASRITPPRLAPGVEAKIALDISVELDCEGTIEDLSCSQHATRMGANKSGVVVSLSREDELLDRDFVLRWRVATDRLQSSFLVYSKTPGTDKGTALAKGTSKTQYYGMVSLVPSMAIDEIGRPSRDVIFVLDRSGSMQGIKMASAARACGFLLATLGPSDRFAIEAFDDSTDWMTASDGGNFFDADEAGLDAGIKFLRTIEARGGTELHGALASAFAVMDKRQSKAARMPVIVILTDGEVSNESSIFKAIQSKLGDNRVFTVGIDTAVNDGFLRRLSSLGGGTATFVEPGAQLEAALSHVGREIGTPLITDLSIEDINCGLDKDSIAPNNLSDLFEGRTVNAFFRLSPAKVKDLSTLKIKLKGTYADGKSFVTEVGAKTTDVQALPQLWAKSFVVDLEDRYRMAASTRAKEIEKQIVEVAVEHSLLTKFTAFVVVDHAEVVNQDGSVRKVVQPVQMPAKWQDQPAPQAMPMIGGTASYGAQTASSGAWGQAAPAPAQMQGSRIQSVGRFYGGSGGAASPAAFSDQSDQDSWGAPSSAAYSHQSDQDGWGGAAPGQAASSSNEDEIETGSWRAFSPPTGGKGSLPPRAPSPPSQPPAPSSQTRGGLGSFPSQQAFDAAIDNLFGQDLGINAQINMPKASPHPRSVEQLLEKEWDELQKRYQEFDQSLRQILRGLDQGQIGKCDHLDQARLELLKTLSLLSIASQLPLLQKYLRADLLQLIAALLSAKTVSKKLKDLGREHEEKLERISEEISQLKPEEEKPFWGSTI